MNKLPGLKTPGESSGMNIIGYGAVLYQLSLGMRIGLVWFGIVWYGLVRFGMVWYGLVWFGMFLYGFVWFFAP